MIQQVENPALEIHDLTVSYDKKPVLWGIDLSIPRGALCGIIGPNGAGKSTLIKAIMNLVDMNSGYVKLFDQTLDEVRKKVSYVPQRESVDWDFPASVLDVVLMGRYANLGLFKNPRRADKDAALKALEMVGMEKYSKRQISQLSGGQQQRVFLARALTQNADIYFLDEPFSGVDAATEKAIFQILKNLSKDGKTIIVVHHDLQSVEPYFEWVILLNLRLVASGPTKQVFTPALLEETYGGKLTLLTEVGELVKKGEFEAREKQ
ncbi:manganese/zinc/iron transport system ATP- binding protein [Ekhidna lutea]|uniref:Manganese/zinc/iron transport system ATP- binding protein n=1 Tax=Ekhidna lutea TaxID=447679 RepID=A0A239H6N2_EKHLU|nr:metal ABC transporter ATP-binding protein [Ekhidna lutea]SNS76805.1 manganese/zinc/iron transport system ATP- binding protein [Ekhidna lutea]